MTKPRSYFVSSEETVTVSLPVSPREMTEFSGSSIGLLSKCGLVLAGVNIVPVVCVIGVAGDADADSVKAAISDKR